MILDVIIPLFLRRPHSKKLYRSLYERLRRKINGITFPPSSEKHGVYAYTSRQEKRHTHLMIRSLTKFQSKEKKSNGNFVCIIQPINQ